MKFVLVLAFCSAVAAVDFEACAFITEREGVTSTFVPLQKKYDGQRTWARIDPKTRTVETKWGAYWIDDTWSFGDIGGGLSERSQYVDGQSGTNCLNEGSVIHHSESDPVGSLKRINDLRATQCPPIKGKLKVPKIPLGEEASFRDCVEKALTKNDIPVSGLYYDSKAKKCYIAVYGNIPKIEDAIEDAGDGHFSCSFDGPVTMPGGVYKPNSTPRETIGWVSNLQQCYDLGVAKYGQLTPAVMRHYDSKCQAMTGVFHGFDLNENSTRISMVSPFPKFDSRDCYVVVEGSSRMEPYMFAPQPRESHSSRTWANLGRNGDGQVAYGWGIYWSPSVQGDFSISTFQRGHDRVGIIDGDENYPTSHDNECFVDGTPVKDANWADGGTLRVLKNPRHAACVPIAGKLTVPTVELAENVATFRDCLALAFDEHSDKLITALHYDLSAKTCNAALVVPVPDIKAAVDGQFNHSSCSFAVPTEIHGDLTEHNVTEEVGDAADMKTCHQMVWRKYAPVAHAALLKDGKCNAITEKVKGFVVSENGGSVMAPVPPFKYFVPHEECYAFLEGSDKVQPQLYVPQEGKVVNGARTWAQVSSDRSISYNWGIYWASRQNPARYYMHTHGSHPSVSGRILGGAAQNADCFEEGTPAQWWLGTSWRDARRVLVLRDPRHMTCPPVRGKLTVPTAELAKDIDSFRDCVAVAFDKHRGEPITGLHYDMTAKTCNAAMGIPLPDIGDVITGSDFQVSCTFSMPLEVVGHPSNNVEMDNLNGKFDDLEECYVAVRSQFAPGTHDGVFLANDGTCGGIKTRIESLVVLGHEPEKAEGKISYLPPFPEATTTTTTTTSSTTTTTETLTSTTTTTTTETLTSTTSTTTTETLTSTTTTTTTKTLTSTTTTTTTKTLTSTTTTTTTTTMTGKTGDATTVAPTVPVTSATTTTFRSTTSDRTTTTLNSTTTTSSTKAANNSATEGGGVGNGIIIGAATGGAAVLSLVGVAAALALSGGSDSGDDDVEGIEDLELTEVLDTQMSGQMSGILANR